MHGLILKSSKLVYALGVALFFALVHYKGYDNDAAVYLLQIMNYLQPERFVNDVPFMFGNQDSFSVFSPVISTVFKLFGVNKGGLIATFVMQLLLCFALVSFVVKYNRLYGEEKWTLAIVVLTIVVLAGKEYGVDGFYLPMLEPFLVARVFSEILVVGGLIFLLDKNRYAPLVFFVLASFMHPLMGGWGILLWGFFYYPKCRIPIMVLALLAPLTGFIHIGRFDFYPIDWKPIYLKPGLKEFALYLGLCTFWLAMYRELKQIQLSRLSICLFFISLIGFYLQLVSSYTEHILLYQVQPFRMQWLCSIPVIPVFAIYVYNHLRENLDITLRDVGTLFLGISAAAQYCNVVLLLLAIVLLYAPFGLLNGMHVSDSWAKVVFCVGLAFLLLNSACSNYIQLAMEQGIGSAGGAVALLGASGYLSHIEILLLFVLSFVCFVRNNLGYALIFSLSICVSDIKVLPIVAVVLCLFPKLGLNLKKGLFAFAVSCSFFELLNSMHEVNTTQKFPLEGSPVACVILLVILFIVVFWIQGLQRKNEHKILPLLVVFFSLAVWDGYKWDVRNDAIVENEKQMDAFFETMIFPQVADRGKMLFAVEGESPIQSRINFLTGAYADASIYVGEIFYKDQYLESNRRRSALLTGSSIETDLKDYGIQMMKVYQNTDTLLARVNYLCDEKEISHFATDIAELFFPKHDSVYLDQKHKFVWLYGCPSN